MNFALPLHTGLVIASPFIGSFLGVLAWRLPEGRSPFFTRSRCPNCDCVLGARDLIPLVSYAIQRGKCRYCQSAIDAFHPAMEVAALIVAGAADWAVHMTPDRLDLTHLMIQGCLFGWWLLLLAAIDLRSTTLPDYLTLPLLGIGLAFAAQHGRADFHLHSLAALLGWAAFGGVALLYRKLRARDGLGGGDAKLLAAGGGWLGPFILPEIVFVGAVVTLAGAWLTRKASLSAQTRIPFGPGLAFALWGGWLLEIIGQSYG